MQLDKLPLPKARATMLALRAHSALAAFRNSSAGLHEWCSLAEAFNTVNALISLGKSFHGLTREDAKILYLGLRNASESGQRVGVHQTLLAPLTCMVAGYDNALQTMARRTIMKAMEFVDRCVAQQSELDLNAWMIHNPHPPMLTAPEIEIKTAAAE